MDGHWTPSLRVSESGGICRLWLGAYAFGDGESLQEAADDLVDRVLRLALGFRSGGGIACPRELGPPDLRWLEFIHELGGIAAAGGDIRERLFGAEREAA
jgi:hypothetical protein